jgi:hypothetical protein
MGIHRLFDTWNAHKPLPEILLLLRVFTAAETCLLSRCLAYTYIHIQTDGKDAAEMDSGAMILYRPSFVKTGSGIQKLIEGGVTQITR